LAHTDTGGAHAEIRIALTTVGNRSDGERIARALVESRLAACVNIVGSIHSVYRWDGKVEESDEYLLMIKTTEARIASLAEALKALHSYELPEFVVLPVASGSDAYLRWIEGSVR
jgi:periplasmic divalent cation tolerance protein